MTLSQTLSGGRKGTEKPRGAANSEMGEGGGGRRVQKSQQGAGQATGARASALSRVWGTKNFTGRQEPALLRPHSSGGSVRTKEADGIPREWIQRDGKNPDMLSHVHEFVKDCVCPHGPAPTPVLC